MTVTKIINRHKRRIAIIQCVALISLILVLGSALFLVFSFAASVPIGQ